MPCDAYSRHAKIRGYTETHELADRLHFYWLCKYTSTCSTKLGRIKWIFYRAVNEPPASKTCSRLLTHFLGDYWPFSSPLITHHSGAKSTYSRGKVVRHCSKLNCRLFRASCSYICRLGNGCSFAKSTPFFRLVIWALTTTDDPAICTIVKSNKLKKQYGRV